MEPDDVIGLLKKAKVDEALIAADSVGDRKQMAQKLSDFGAALSTVTNRLYFSEAILKKAAELDPTNPAVHYNLGVLYTDPRVLAEGPKYVSLAVVAYHKALAADPNYHRARYNLGILYFLMGEKDRARKQYRKLLERVGDDFRYRSLGVLFLEDERLNNITSVQ